MDHARSIVSSLIGEADQFDLPLPPDAPGPDISIPDLSAILNPVLKVWADSRKHGKPIADYAVEDHGVTNSQYWQGAGVAYSRYDVAYTGVGENAHEAMEDCLEQAAMDGYDIRKIENEFDPNSEETVERAVRDANPDMDEDDIDTGDVYYYVVLKIEEFDPEKPPTNESLNEGEFDSLVQRLTKDAVDAATPKQLPVGETFLRGTSRAEDVLEMGLRVLEAFSKPDYDYVMDAYAEEFEAYKRIKEGSNENRDFEVVDDLAYEVLPSKLQDLCPPYTFFGPHEADGDWGVWPNFELLESDIEEGRVAKIYAGSEEAIKTMRGEYRVPSSYIWIFNPDTYESSLWDGRTNKPIWQS